MKAYIIQIVGAALLAVFADIFAPDGWKKYMGIVTGMVLLTIIVTPLARLNGIDILSGYRETDYLLTQGSEVYTDLLRKEFAKSIATDVKERIRQEFSIDAEVEVDVEVNYAGNVDKINKITITGSRLTNVISDRISFIYDVDEVLINAI